ncbi:hypothetical protein TNCV_3035101 [Trichonephila clavipes]|nr:hypothetical protein TNCV_3035101 [Trichonephila clavipes]
MTIIFFFDYGGTVQQHGVKSGAIFPQTYRSQPKPKEMQQQMFQIEYFLSLCGPKYAQFRIRAIRMFGKLDTHRSDSKDPPESLHR